MAENTAVDKLIKELQAQKQQADEQLKEEKLKLQKEEDKIYDLEHF